MLARYYLYILTINILELIGSSMKSGGMPKMEYLIGIVLPTEPYGTVRYALSIGTYRYGTVRYPARADAADPFSDDS